MTDNGGHSFTEGSEVKENVFELFVSMYPPFRACFRIGVQTFSVCDRDDKKEAEWFVERLRSAFQTLEGHQTSTLKSKLKQRDETINELKDTIEKKELAFKLITKQQFEELKLEREINAKLHTAMVSAEQRGSDKANEENERLKTELAEVKRFMQELYHSGKVPELWRVRMQRFVK